MKLSPPQIEKALSYTLRFGVFFCSFILIFGITWGWLFPGSHQGITALDISLLLNGQRFPSSGVPRTILSLKEGLLALNSNSIISFGLICLIALPILRVGITLILFLLKKDYIYVGITAIVLFILLGSIFLGKGL